MKWRTAFWTVSRSGCVADRIGALSRYLEDRMALGEPDFFLATGDRSDLLERARRAGTPPEEAPVSPDVSRAEAGSIGVLDLDSLRREALTCTRCPLHESRRHVVFAEGDAHARVMCVGEAPGAKEDETGRPFVGRAGRLLDRLLVSVGFRREEVFICNVLKCRPPGNRDPEPLEIERCSPFLRRQIQLVQPDVIVAFGAFAARTLLETRESLGRLRGRTHRFEGRPLVATYHPAALLRNPGWTRPAWEDLQRVREIVDAASVEP